VNLKPFKDIRKKIPVAYHYRLKKYRRDSPENTVRIKQIQQCDCSGGCTQTNCRKNKVPDPVMRTAICTNGISQPAFAAKENYNIM